MSDVKTVHARSKASFQAALTQEMANYQQATANGDTDEQVRSAQVMAGLRASMRELDSMVAEVTQPQRQQQQQQVNEFGLTEEQAEIALKSFSAPDMSPDQKMKLYANNVNRLATERAAGRYPMPEKN